MRITDTHIQQVAPPPAPLQLPAPHWVAAGDQRLASPTFLAGDQRLGALAGAEQLPQRKRLAADEQAVPRKRGHSASEEEHAAIRTQADRDAKVCTTIRDSTSLYVFLSMLTTIVFIHRLPAS